MNISTNFLKLLGSQDLLIKLYDGKTVMYGYERCTKSAKETQISAFMLVRAPTPLLPE